VNEYLLEVRRMPRHLVHDGGDLHEIGPRAHDVKDAFQNVTLMSTDLMTAIHPRSGDD
jgi:hypothetical protein